MGKILFWTSIFLITIVTTRYIWNKKKKQLQQLPYFLSTTEGFATNSKKDVDFHVRTDPKDIYDDFYVEIYDSLVFNPIKNYYEVDKYLQ